MGLGQHIFRLRKPIVPACFDKLFLPRAFRLESQLILGVTASLPPDFRDSESQQFVSAPIKFFYLSKPTVPGCSDQPLQPRSFKLRKSKLLQRVSISFFNSDFSS